MAGGGFIACEAAGSLDCLRKRRSLSEQPLDAARQRKAVSQGIRARHAALFRCASDASLPPATSVRQRGQAWVQGGIAVAQPLPESAVLRDGEGLSPVELAIARPGRDSARDLCDVAAQFAFKGLTMNIVRRRLEAARCALRTQGRQAKSQDHENRHAAPANADAMSHSPDPTQSACLPIAKRPMTTGFRPCAGRDATAGVSLRASFARSAAPDPAAERRPPR